MIFPLEAAASGGVTALLVGFGLLLSKNIHGNWTNDHRHGVQRAHRDPTPRVGGLALLIGLMAAFAYASPDVRVLLKPMIIASLPAFFFGFAEDLTRRVRWQERLLATICSALLIWWLTGVSVTRIDLAPADWALSFLLISVGFTVFAVAGMSNAFNMVDGLHGLSAGLAVIALAGLAWIAADQGDVSLARLAIICMAVVLGFLLLNFPFGKLFMGDGGAYLIGFLVAWVAVLLPYRNPAVSPWASLLVCFYPFVEVLVSVARRAQRAHHPSHPDGLHLHSMLRRRLARRILPWRQHWASHAVVSLFIWGYAAVGVLLAVAYAKDTAALILACLGLGAWFLLTYRLLFQGLRMRSLA
jgi:UDP-N-acetylmuramyl pentapeptide phosphotransferase/UDP-N-acetylglucosamine-1-phosphate transferase